MFIIILIIISRYLVLYLLCPILSKRLGTRKNFSDSLECSSPRKSLVKGERFIRQLKRNQSDLKTQTANYTRKSTPVSVVRRTFSVRVEAGTNWQKCLVKLFSCRRSEMRSNTERGTKFWKKKKKLCVAVCH